VAADSCDDDQLADALQAGDEDAFAWLLERRGWR